MPSPTRSPATSTVTSLSMAPPRPTSAGPPVPCTTPAASFVTDVPTLPATGPGTPTRGPDGPRQPGVRVRPQGWSPWVLVPESSPALRRDRVVLRSGSGPGMEVGSPQGGGCGTGGTHAPGGVVEGAGAAGGVGCGRAVVGEVGVDIAGNGSGGIVIDGPQGSYDVSIAGELKRG